VTHTIGWGAGKVKGDTVSHEQFSQSSVLFCESVSFSRSSRKCVFEANHFLLESFDVKLFPFPVRPCSKSVRDLAHCIVVVTFVPDDLALVAVSRPAYCLASDLSSLAVDHLVLVSQAQR
jgi:hypothetical protein